MDDERMGRINYFIGLGMHVLIISHAATFSPHFSRKCGLPDSEVIFYSKQLNQVMSTQLLDFCLQVRVRRHLHWRYFSHIPN